MELTLTIYFLLSLKDETLMINVGIMFEEMSFNNFSL